jgi:hypothetical protein
MVGRAITTETEEPMSGTQTDTDGGTTTRLPGR